MQTMPPGRGMSIKKMGEFSNAVEIDPILLFKYRLFGDSVKGF